MCAAIMPSPDENKMYIGESTISNQKNVQEGIVPCQKSKKANCNHQNTTGTGTENALGLSARSVSSRCTEEMAKNDLFLVLMNEKANF